MGVYNHLYLTKGWTTAIYLSIERAKVEKIEPIWNLKRVNFNSKITVRQIFTIPM